MDTWLAQENIKISPKSKIPKEPVSLDLVDQYQDEYSELFANDENKGMDTRQVEEHEVSTKIKTIKYVQLGFCYKIETWYYSPFPSEY
jgi:hypothetical protein